MTRTCTIPTTLSLQAATVLEREARQLHESYTVPGTSPRRWDCPAAQRDHDRYVDLAKQLRAAAQGR